MDKNTFIEKLFDLLKKQFGEEVTITQKKIEKSNGISYEGFTIKKKTEYISPVISIDNCYEDYSAGSSLDEIMKEIVHQYEESTRNNPFLSAKIPGTQVLRSFLRPCDCVLRRCTKET